MKLYRIFSSCIFLILSLSGCKPTQVISTVKEKTVPETSNSVVLHGYPVLPGTWLNDDPGVMQKNIARLIEKSVTEGYNSVFFFVQPDYKSHGLNALYFATDLAHKNNQKIYAGIILSEFNDTTKDIFTPQAITVIKNMISHLVTACNIDGMVLVTGTAPADVVESLFVEAMLIKPYLEKMVVSSGENGYQDATSYMDDVKPDRVVGLDLSALFPDNPAGQKVYIDNRTKSATTDSEGRIGFITPVSDTIEFEAGNKRHILLKNNWSVPYKYSVMPDNSVMRKSPWVEIRSNIPANSGIPVCDLLCKTEYPASVSINNVPVKQYKTGIFFNRINLNEGPNHIRATIITPDSLKALYEFEINYHKTDRSKKPFPLWIDEKTIEPASDIELLPEDMVRVSFQGSAGQEGYVMVSPGKIKIKCSREDFNDYSLYRCELPLQRLKTGTPCEVTLVLVPSTQSKEKPLNLALKNKIMVRRLEDFPYVRVIKENSRLTYNTGAPRLGGPIRAELGPGVIMKTNGKNGNNFRIRLSRNEYGIINSSDVELMPGGTVQPSYFITSMSCRPSKDADILTIPYPEPVPYEVQPDPDRKRIIINLFGVETSSTWITHLSGRKIIDNVTWKQVTPETYQISVNLKTSAIWGYYLRQEGKSLVLRLRYPPVYDLKTQKPLSGLKIAIEAGHGGSGSGAIGLSGLVEKDVNLDLSFRLGELCKSMGAEVVQVRDSDKDMGLIEKRDIAESSDANLLICIHANAGGGGYLQVGGTSTYYNNPFWAPMAESIYKRLLELKLKEFGEVGSFNYTVIRVSRMPAILVEQAFLSNAEDEEKLADPEFRQQMAGKIYEGVIDYLGTMHNLHDQ